MKEFFTVTLSARFVVAEAAGFSALGFGLFYSDGSGAFLYNLVVIAAPAAKMARLAAVYRVIMVGIGVFSWFIACHMGVWSRMIICREPRRAMTSKMLPCDSFARRVNCRV